VNAVHCHFTTALVLYKLLNDAADEVDTAVLY